MPKAKMVRLRKLPPLNKSNSPRAEPCAWVKMRSNSVTLIPGVGMCAPMRYTASNASVKSTRFRKSSTRNMFRMASINRFIAVPYEFS